MPIGLRFEFNQAQFKALNKKLNSFERADVLHQTLEEVGEFMRGKLKEYPGYQVRLAQSGLRQVVSKRQAA